MNLPQLDIGSLVLLPLGLALIPLGVIMMTSFTKISIVLALLRNALGVQQVPSNMVLAGIALAATLLVMSPVTNEIKDGLDVDGVMHGTVQLSAPEVVAAVMGPLETFMRKHVDRAELQTLVDTARKANPGVERSSSDLMVLVPAFVFSEVGGAFRIGMYLAIGFAVIDLIVANLMMAMGMTMFPPNSIATPLKLLVFVVTAGFSRTVHGLIGSYTA